MTTETRHRGTGARRSWLLALAVPALVVALVACGSIVPYAADVGGQRIGQDDLESELRAIADNEEYLKFVESQTQVRGSGTGVFDSAFTAQVLTTQIVYRMVAEDLAARKVKVTQADLDAARPSVVRRVGGDAVFGSFTKGYQDTLVQRAAEVNALAVALQGQGTVDDVARTYFKDHPAEFARTCASHILVPTAEQAAAVKARLDAGEEFATVASAESKDARSAAQGGDLGCFDGNNQLVPEFAAAAFSQPLNEVGAPVQTQFGFHLIKVASRTSPTYEQAAAQAREKAVSSGRASLEEWFAGAVDKTKVSVNPRYGRFEKNGADSSVVPPQVPAQAPTRGARCRLRRRHPRPARKAVIAPMPRVVVVGLGPAGPDHLTSAATAAVTRVRSRFLRTARHPAAAAVPFAFSFDGIYETAASLEEVYGRIVDALVEAAEEHDTVLYAVPGSPLVAERTVELLFADARVDVEVVPAMSFLDLAWARLRVDPLAAGVRLVDGQRFVVEAAGDRGPLLVAQCDSRRVFSDIKLAVDAPPPGAIVLQRLGLADESVREVAWDDLDRAVDPDHLTSLYIAGLPAPVAGEVVRFAELVRTLRERCPWDREQTHQTLTRHLLEETYEVLEAIEALDSTTDQATAFGNLEEELGDLLFQVVFHATLAAEEGQFTLADVARRVHDKLVHRHPHVFGSVEAGTPGEVVRNWEQIKKAEKGHASLMDGISGDLPSLLYAHKVQRKAASAGLEWLGPAPGGRAWLEAEERDPGELGHADVGELLFAVVDAARRAGVDPEAALRGTAGVFRRRFQAVEATAADQGIDLADVGPAELAARWEAAGVS